MRSSLVPLLLLLFAASACVPSARRGSGDPNTLLEAEIRAVAAADAYEVVERLRPRWLRPGPPRSLRLETVILVYLNNARLGGVEALRDVKPEEIREMRLLDSAQAGTLPGLGSQHVDRVIRITTKQVR